MSRRTRATVPIALARLRHHRVSTVLSVLAVTLAVLATTTFAGVGVGVTDTGRDRLDAARQDLWVTGGPARIGPGGPEGGIGNAHRVAASMEAHGSVVQASPIAFRTVYVGTAPDDLQAVVGVGVPNVGSGLIDLRDGPGFGGESDHYANGTYDGPMTREVIVDPRTAQLLDVGVGDEIHVGGTVSRARSNRFTVVGISPTVSRFLGAPTVTLHLAELQTLSGTAGTDDASLVTVTLREDADPAAVAADLERAYPDLRVRTNREQFRALLADQAAVVATAATLVALAVLAGAVLSANALALLVHQQRRELAALKAAGVSSGTLLRVVAAQAGLVGLAGGIAGLALTPVFAGVIDRVALHVVGFAGLTRTPPWVLALGFAVAAGIGAVSALVAGWRVAGLDPLTTLRE